MSRRGELLGQSFAAAQRGLRKMLLWNFVRETSQDTCFRCGEQIEDVDDLSIEHKEPWQSALDPKAAFFDLENIAFSHLSCNLGAFRLAKTYCPAKHPYSGDNLIIENYGNGKIKRACRACGNHRAKVYQQRKRAQRATKGGNSR